MHALASNWHRHPWDGLAWLETGIKSIAIMVAVLALQRALGHGEFAPPVGTRLVEVAVLGILSLGLVAAIADRLKERELVSMFFVVFNNVGHWGMFIALLSRSDAATLLLPFCGLMLLGDVVKLVFFQVHQFGTRQYSSRTIQKLTSVYVAGYAVLVGLALLPVFGTAPPK